MRFLSNALRRGVLLAVCLVSPHVAANVIIANTRVVFPADQREVTVKLSNVGDTPSLVQAWIDDGRPQSQTQDLHIPFNVLPAMFRLDAGKGQSLRLFHAGDAMPTDRESLYWLNVLEVPPKESGNALQLSLRSRIKLLYRPAGLQGQARDAHQKISWQWLREGRQWVLVAENASPYVVNLANLTVLQEGQAEKALEPSHVLPFASTRFRLENMANPAKAQLQYAFIDDHGAVREAPPLTKVRVGE